MLSVVSAAIALMFILLYIIEKNTYVGIILTSLHDSATGLCELFNRIQYFFFYKAIRMVP